MSNEYYATLGLAKTATIADINKAYRKLALKYHPKRSIDPFANKKFSFACEAYDVLSQEKWRAIYDKYGPFGLSQYVPIGDQEIFDRYTFHGDCEKVFKDFFGVSNPFADIFIPNMTDEISSDLKGPSKKTGVRDSQGDPSQLVIQLTLEEMYLGCTKKVQLSKQSSKSMQFNDDTVTIHIKPGCPIGRIFNFPQPEIQDSGVDAEDVMFIVKALPHDRFVREENNLIYKTDIHLVNALSGVVIDIVTLDNRLLHFPITDVIKPDYRKALPGEGMPIEEEPDTRGNMIIEFNLIFPKALSLNQKELIKKALPVPVPQGLSEYPREKMENPCN